MRKFRVIDGSKDRSLAAPPPDTTAPPDADPAQAHPQQPWSAPTG